MKTTALFSLAGILLITVVTCSGSTKNNTVVSSIPADTAGEHYIKEYFQSSLRTEQLNFPNLTKSIYAAKDYHYVWFQSWNKQDKLWDAMMLLDCVVTYGLVPFSYHPNDLTYNNLKQVLEVKEEDDFKLKTKTDILLTDAVLTFIAHLHFGQANPYISASQIDNKSFKGFRIDSVFAAALDNNFRETILNAQPRDEGYKKLQDFLRLAVGQYTGDCYEFSEDSLKLIAINMERYKWNAVDNDAFIVINIPSFSLQFTDKDVIQNFKVIVGRPSNPTPLLSSYLSSFNTAPDWNVPARIFRRELLPKAIKNPNYLRDNNFAIYNRNGTYVEPTALNLEKIAGSPSGYYARQSPGCDNALGRIAFYFKNPYSVYLHDTPQKELFNKNYRAFSHGCIRIENPEKLLAGLLDKDGASKTVYSEALKAMNSYKRFTYTFKKRVPITTRYITCEIKEGFLIKYDDVYSYDRSLINKLFKSTKFLPVSNN